MDKNNGCGGVKVTYIETQFVTSDAAGFKDLVQRLTGRAVAPAQASAAVAAPPPLRPRPCRATAMPQGCGYYTTPSAGSHGRAPPCQMEELNDMADLSDLFYFGGSEHRRGPHDGGYNDFPY